MNWTKIVIAGVAGGVAMNLADWLTHGFIMRDTYMGLPEVFTQEEANPGFFFLVAVCMALAAAFLYAKTHGCWAGGLKGGVVFGLCLGLVLFFVPFYNSLVIDGFPYYLAWCQGGMNLIALVVAGAVIGLIYKP